MVMVESLLGKLASTPPLMAISGLSTNSPGLAFWVAYALQSEEEG